MDNATNETDDQEFGRPGLINRAKQQFPRELVSAAECVFGGAPRLDSINPEFIYDFASVVFEHRSRYAKFDYVSACLRIQEQMKNAAEAVDRAISASSELIAEDHWLVWESASVMMKERMKDRPAHCDADLGSTPEFGLKLAADWLHVLAGTSVLLRHKYDPSTGGRHALPYERPTRELMQCWELWSARKELPEETKEYIVWTKPTPTARKAVKQSETEPDSAGNRSTRFCEIGLRLIDSKVTLENVITSVNKARGEPDPLFDATNDDIPANMEDLLLRWLPEQGSADHEK